MGYNNPITGVAELEKTKYIDKLVEELPVLRIKLGLSQEELGQLIGLSRQTYSTLETQKRKMTWSVFLSLIFIFDNNEQTHGFVRDHGLFPEELFESNENAEVQKSLTTDFIKKDILEKLDDQALHSIETMIMVEYARCNNMSGDSVIKAFNGRSFGKITDKDKKIQVALNELKK